MLEYRVRSVVVVVVVGGGGGGGGKQSLLDACIAAFVCTNFVICTST